MPRITPSLLLLASAFAVGAGPEPVRLEVTRDLWLSSYPKEQEGNNGKSPKPQIVPARPSVAAVRSLPSPPQRRSPVRAQAKLEAPGILA